MLKSQNLIYDSEQVKTLIDGQIKQNLEGNDKAHRSKNNKIQNFKKKI